MCTKKEKEIKIRKTVESLYRKRYQGKIETKFFSFDNSKEIEFDRVMSHFGFSIPKFKEIIFPEELLDELEASANDLNLELSTLINCYLLQMLERNKRTIEHTKARKTYIKNNLHPLSTYVKCVEHLEEFEKNIMDKDFIKYKEISFNEESYDETVYIENVLLNHGYSLKQIEKVEKEEKKVFGTYESLQGETMHPIRVDAKIRNNNIEYFIFIHTRLGLHYILLKQENGLNNYDDIEKFLNNKLKGGKKIWELYKEYLQKEIDSNNLGLWEKLK